MVTLKIETKTDSFEDAVVLIKEALKSIRKGSQAGIIGGGIGECTFDVDLSAAQQNAHLTGGGLCAECGSPSWAHGAIGHDFVAPHPQVA